MRLNQDKLEALRRWGQALRQADGEELAAAGRAVLMLIEDLERARLELQRMREQMNREAQLGVPEEPSSTLQQRLHRVLRREPESLPILSSERVEDDEPDFGSDETRISPQAWIESLRRQT